MESLSHFVAVRRKWFQVPSLTEPVEAREFNAPAERPREIVASAERAGDDVGPVAGEMETWVQTRSVFRSCPTSA